jgi:carboxylesterase type B
MLYIHGGNFEFQGANSPLFDGQYFSNFSDVIIVTIQYRLGINKLIYVFNPYNYLF